MQIRIAGSGGAQLVDDSPRDREPFEQPIAQLIERPMLAGRQANGDVSEHEPFSECK